jgi:predicted amidohydrolase
MPNQTGLKLGIFQAIGTPGDVSANLALLAEKAKQASEQGVALLVLPELFLTGYNIGDAAWKLAEPLDGPSLQAAAQIAQECNLALLFGYAELSQGSVYNSAVLIDATGEIAANYRKIHLYGSEEQRLFQPGNQWVIHSIAGVTVGVLICYDVEFPEAVRALVQQGAELIAVPTALPAPCAEVPTALEVAKTLVPTRALENQVFVAYVNHCGSEEGLDYCGLSCVVGPDGRELVRAGLNEALLIAEINPVKIQQERAVYSYLGDRRPELYGPV